MQRRGASRQPAKGQRAKRPKGGPKAARKASPARSSIEHPQEQLVERLRRERDEAIEFQTATGEVLRIVASSPDDLQRVFDAMLEKAISLCAAKFGSLFLYDGKGFTVAADRNLPPEYAQAVRGQFFTPEANTGFRRLVESKMPLHVTDMFDASYAKGEPLRKAAVELGGVRSLIAVPLLKKGELIGNFSIYKEESGGFAENQIALVTTFTDQAVIAIQNARLFEQTKEALRKLEARSSELAESLQHQTATSQILSVISSSRVDIQPVFDAIVNSAARLFEPCGATITTLKDGQLHWNATAATLPDFDIERAKAIYPISFDPERAPSARALLERRIIEIPDIAAPDTPEFTRKAAAAGGFQSATFVPLIKQDKGIGTIILTHQRAGFKLSEKRLALVRTFADQAVIAIENTRLFDEVNARTRELEESLQQQTATADVLKVISRSSVELETVLETLVDTVARLCGADQVYMFHLRHDLWHLVADWGLSAEGREFFLTHPFTPGRGSTSGRAALERRAVLIPDVLQDPEYTLSEGQKIAGYRTTLGIPLLREDKLIGVFGIARTRVEAFTEKEIELATTFADQAVIAIENARLFDEIRERQAELRVTFDNMGDGVVMFDAQARLTAWNRNFQEMLDLPDAFLAERPSYAEYFRYLVDRGEYSIDVEADLSRANEDPRQELRIERTRPDGRVIEVRRNPVPGGGFVLIYGDITERKRAEQAVRAARDAAETALRDLQAAQDRLVQTEKLASLGQLTAGIAHEIKNPLNFVNNFSTLSVELVNEMNDVLERAKLDDKNREELDEIRDLLKGNLEKVVQHGKRADSIVKNMLLHSRSGSGEHRPVEINAVIEESLNLAYHGARAEGKDFNITLERDFDSAVGVADIYPQEITRVLLNLISNGFYAATKRAFAASDGFEPKLKAVTRNLGEKVEIRIRDNGTGIPLEIQEKIFNPFFTTKPAGEGTGLGLSMSHDIVVKQHGGTIDIVTEPGSFTEFIITLPRNIPAGAEAGGRDEHLYSRGR
jgi:two-component system, NtrC family, sensor kinase